jgi:hypothetical protein
MQFAIVALSAVLTSTAPVKAVLSGDPDAGHLRHLAQRNVDISATEVTIAGKIFDIATSNGSAALIDREVYSESTCKKLIGDLQLVYRKSLERDAEFDLTTSCSTLVDLFLITHSSNSMAGLGHLVLVSHTEYTLRSPEDKEFVFNIEPETPKLEYEERLAGQQLNLRLKSRPNIYVKPSLSLHFLIFMSNHNRAELQKAIFEVMWKKRQALSEEYSNIYDQIGNRLTRLNTPVSAPTLVAGKPFRDIPIEHRQKLGAWLLNQGLTTDEVNKLTVKSVKATLKLKAVVKSPAGKLQLNQFDLPPFLP